MSTKFYDKNEGIEREESINNYKHLFSEFVTKLPSLDESLEQIFKSGGLENSKINIFIKQLRDDCEKNLKDRWDDIYKKYPSLTHEQAIIIASYTCEAMDSQYSPYLILNRNLVSNNREQGLKNVSKYFYLLLKTLRLLPRYYPPTTNNYLYRCIRVKVNLMIDPYDEKVVPYIRGKNKTFWTFTSTSPNPKVSIGFLGKNKEIKNKDDFKYGTVFMISGKVWGYDISLFNVFNEEEILLEPERKYYIENHFPEVNDLIYVICQVKDTPLVLENDINNIDNSLILNSNTGKRIKLMCKLGSQKTKMVEVFTGNPINVFKQKLNILDEATKFCFKGITYSINSNLTFEEIGLKEDTKIFFINQAIG